ncbi:DUF87 domain-containing protein [Mycoplasma sp. NEAQ87857]|uniref:helicase HerA domain-containing protein n=1 Tax=Mycoplasma sp. NEAQ87857 TaxID=2683967 RepID=UPI0013183217|nr:DUF87 domain-containing protein [Mycoplasma sp. NEAQ87857]QGZ97239.1 DUF87 domain-containing protein [Mycoplasma sp. NEAQ87857]QGZ97868.1 DUF87 domain-containing protein [Mycoplasma sp. NEAQ87857]
MIQPSSLWNKKISLFNDKILPAKDKVYVLVIALFSFAISFSVYDILSGYIQAIIGGSIFLFLLSLLFKPSNSSERMYVLIYKKIQFLFTTKKYKDNDFLKLKNINDKGQIEIKDQKMYILSLNPFDVWRLKEDEKSLYINAFHQTLAELPRKYTYKFVKVNLANKLEQNKADATKINQNLQANDESIYNIKYDYINQVYQDLQNIETSTVFKNIRYFLVVSGQSNDIDTDINHIKMSFNTSLPFNATIVNDKEYIISIFNSLLNNDIYSIENNKVASKPTDIQIYNEYVKINDKLMTFNILKEFPIELNDDFALNIFNTTNSNSIWTLNKLPEDKIVRMLDRARELQQFNRIDVKSWVKNKQESLEDSAIDLIADEYAYEKTAFFQVNFLEIRYFDEPKELNKIKQEINKRNKNHRITTHFLEYQQLQALKILLFDQALSKYNHTFSSMNLAKTWPMIISYFNDKNSFILAENAYSNDVLFFDNTKKTFKRPSSSMFFIGKTGSGKTTSISKFLNHHIVKNDLIYIIDPNDDYSSIVKRYGGEVIDYADLSNFNLNILEIKNELYVQESFKVENGQRIKVENVVNTPITSLVQFKIEFLSSLFKVMYPNIKDDEILVLEKVIKETFKKHGFFEPDAKLENLKQITLQDVINFLDELNANDLSLEYNKDLYTEEQLVKALKFLDENFNKITGKYRSFNTEQNFNFNGNLISYNLKEIQNKSPEQTKIIMFILSNEIKKQVSMNFEYNKHTYGMENQQDWRHIVIVVDEIHKFLGGASGIFLVQFFFDLIKTLRKFWGLLIFGTQSFKDFELNESLKNMTKQLLEQSQYFFIYKIESEDVEIFQNLMGSGLKLLDHEKRYILQAQAGECMFIPYQGNKHLIRMYYNPIEQKLFFKTKLKKDEL